MSEEIAEDLPFRGEYAKSGRAGCKHCKINIEKGELRLAVMVKVIFFKNEFNQGFNNLDKYYIML